MVPVGTASASPTPAEAGPAEAPSAQAQPAQSATECTDGVTQTVGAEQDDTFDMTLIEGASAEELSDDVAALVSDDDVTVHASADALAHGEANAYQIETNADEQHTSVSVPITGGYSQPVSNLTVLFDAEGTVVQYAETLFSEADSGNFHISSYVDGELTNSEDTGIPFMSDEELRAEVAEVNKAVAESASTGACLGALLGVSAAFGAVIGYACVGACAVPMTPVTGPVCAACVAGFAALGAATVSQIVNCF